MIKYNRPLLPFVGNKSRWAAELTRIFKMCRSDVSIFDAFGGSFFVSRLAKNILPKAKVVCNDYKKMYQKRLNAIDDTYDAWEKLKDYCGDQGPTGLYKKLTQDQVEFAKNVVEKAKDKETVLTWLNGDYSANKINVNFVYSKELAEQWVRGLRLVDLYCDKKLVEYAKKFDIVILDPPYGRFCKGGRYKHCACSANAYTNDIEMFCMGVIENSDCVILFENEDSTLVKYAENKRICQKYYKNKIRSGASDVMITIGVPCIREGSNGHDHKLGCGLGTR